MANNPAYDEQFWQTVERVAAQVCAATIRVILSGDLDG